LDDSYDQEENATHKPRYQASNRPLPCSSRNTSCLHTRHEEEGKIGEKEQATYAGKPVGPHGNSAIRSRYASIDERKHHDDAAKHQSITDRWTARSLHAASLNAQLGRFP